MFLLEFLCLLMNDACRSWMIEILSLMKLFLKNDGWMNLGSYMKYWVGLVIESCLKNREHEKTKYEIQLYKALWNIL